MTGTTPTQQFYGRWSRLYDLVARRTPGIHRLRDRAIDACNIRLNDLVVEMGCGTGANFAHLHDDVGPDGVVVGLDFTREVLERSREHTSQAGWENVHVIRADATRPPLKEADVVLGTFVVGMFSHPGSVVEGWCGLLRTGGRISLMHMTRSHRWYGPAINLPFRLLVLLSTPGSIRGRWTAHKVLDRRVQEAHVALHSRCAEVRDTEYWFGLIRHVSGIIT